MMTKKTVLKFVFIYLSLNLIACSSDIDGTDTGYELIAEIPSGKLSNRVLPTAYKIELALDPSETTFTGKATIKLTLNGDSKNFFMHQAGLTIDNMSFDGAADRSEYTIHEDDQYLEIISANGEDFKKGDHELAIDFSGKVRRDQAGLYLSRDDNGLRYLSTQFEPITARSAFPCFDEPRFKTPFNIEIKSPAALRVRSNAPLKEAKEDGDFTIHAFEATENLPTYLVAYAVGPFDVVKHDPLPTNDHRSATIPFAAITPKGESAKASFALNAAADLLKYSEDYFESPNPFAKKLDIAAIPEFAAGAMEHPGLVTYKADIMLLDDSPSNAEKSVLLTAMSHEFWHMWFGNLVTLEYWDDIWLQESFATAMSYQAVDALYPDLKPYDELLAGSLSTMYNDSFVSSRKMRQEIKSNDDIYNAFDAITYIKGAATLTMFFKYLGDDVIKKFLQEYMDRFDGKTANTDQFVKVLGNHVESGVAAGLLSFVNQAGTPLVSAEIVCAADKSTATVTLSQQRYVAFGMDVDPNVTWSFPVNYSYSNAGAKIQKYHFFTPKNNFFQVDGCPTRADLNLNANQFGYYLTDKLENKTFTAEEGQAREALLQAKVLQTQFSAKQIEPSVFLEKIMNFKSSKPINKLGFINDLAFLMERTPKYEEAALAATKEFFSEMLDPTLDLSTMDAANLGYWARVNRFMMNYDDSHTMPLQFVIMSAAYFSDYLNGTSTSTLPKGLGELAMTYQLRVASESKFDEATEKLKGLNKESLRNEIVFALGSSNTSARRAKAFDLINDNAIRSNEILRMMFSALRLKGTQDEVWAWTSKNLGTLKVVTTNAGKANLPFLAREGCTAEFANIVNAFFTPEVLKSLPGAARAVEEVVEKIKACAAHKKALQ